MSNKPEAVEVRILEKEFRVACPPGEKESLLQAAEHLNEKMKEIRNSGKIIGSDRIAIMAALNITHEMLQGKSLDLPENFDILNKIQGINTEIGSFLQENK